jgi:hypothetical protein
VRRGRVMPPIRRHKRGEDGGHETK